MKYLTLIYLIKNEMCSIDPLLFKYGIMIDNFSNRILDENNIKIILLSHAHSDHLTGFASFSKKKKKIPVFCTEITKQSVSCMYDISNNNFKSEKYFHPFSPLNNVMIQFLPSYHCDGACMFLLYFLQEDVSILITNDFRYSNEMRNFKAITSARIDILYYDNIFDNLDHSFITYQETFDLFENVIDKLNKKTNNIFVNCSILGFEPILREYAKKKNVKYRLSSSLSSTWRGKQISLLLKDYLILKDNESQDISQTSELKGESNYKANLILSHRKIDDAENGWWIIPTCTTFKLDDKRKGVQKMKVQKNKYYIEFCTHSNQEEIQDFKLIVNASTINPCNYKTLV